MPLDFLMFDPTNIPVLTLIIEELGLWLAIYREFTVCSKLRLGARWFVYLAWGLLS